MVNQESINTKLRMEMSEIEQELRKKTKNKEDEQKKLANSWNLFLGGGAFSILLVFMAIYQHGAWWIAVVTTALGALIGLLSITSENSKIKSLEQEITRLEKKKKELRNSIR